MPSEDLAAAVLEALAAPRARYRSALALTLDGVQARLDDIRSAVGDRTSRLEVELGYLGSRYLAVDRLAAVLEAAPAVEPGEPDVVRRALACLQELAARPAAGEPLRLPPGGHLAALVERALADAGRAMGAGRTVELARTGRYRASDHAGYLDAYPPSLWSQAERRLAPPLVIGLAGADLRPAALADVLDGAVKLVLLVDAPATPAPLVRLITPGVFVAQASDAGVVARLAAWDGPGIAAVMPEGAAAFVHDPAGGRDLHARLTVTAQPAAERLRRVGPLSVAQQRDELEHLSALVAASVASPVSGEPAGTPADDPVGKLAAWLLAQSGAAKGS